MSKISEKINDLLKKEGCDLNVEALTAIEHLDEIVSGDDDIAGVQKWVEEKRKAYDVKVKEVGINELDKWRVDPRTGHISHETGRFFDIIGVRVDGASGREVVSWTQPMVKQPEVNGVRETGILGILCKKINGVRHYLFYLKLEPGNMHKLQLSPTLQATESNLKQVHGGKKPLFAEYFEGSGRGNVLVNVVGVEDGGRFYMKTNRCTIVEVGEDKLAEIPDDYIWLTLPQVKKLLKIDGVVTSLAREIIGSW